MIKRNIQASLIIIITVTCNFYKINHLDAHRKKIIVQITNKKGYG